MTPGPRLQNDLLADSSATDRYAEVIRGPRRKLTVGPFTSEQHLIT